MALEVAGQGLLVKDVGNLEGLSLGRVRGREAVEAEEAESGANRKLEHTQCVHWCPYLAPTQMWASSFGVDTLIV